MASFATACRLSARLARRQTLTSDVASRGLRTSSAARAAQNFTMPALSPTMTEGNIASWRIQEGNRFSAGDVLLEIETDKATMDVEAQDDGILMKIIHKDGAKSVQVGTRIAVLAEEGDDVATLTMPPPPPDNKSSAAPTRDAGVPDPVPAEPDPPVSVSVPKRGPSSRSVPAQTKPLLPSVARLLGENGLDAAAVKDMTPTGPGDRLLKGDVLVYLGKIKASTPADVRERFQKTSHLDLGNIKLAGRSPVNPGVDARVGQEKPATETAAAAAAEKKHVSVPVVLARAVQVQRKMHKTLGVFLPLSTWIERATELANDQLPRAADTALSADELFHQVLGLDKAQGTKFARGQYRPHISVLAPPPTSLVPPRPRQTNKGDLIDVLAGPWPKPAASTISVSTQLTPGISPTAQNLFSLTVPRTEERRARVFLQRVKRILEEGPERLMVEKRFL